jgi:hypothetical protein
MLPVYVYIKDDIPLVTFKCDGCGKRFRASKLYGRSTVIDLKNGAFTSPSKDNRLHIMVCSRTCSHKAPHRTLAQLYAYLETSGAM